MTINTHAIVKNLVIVGGFTETASEAIVEAILAGTDNAHIKDKVDLLEKEQSGTYTEFAVMQQIVATKSNIAELKTELKEDIAELRAELKGDIAELKTELKGDINAVRTEIVALRGEVRAEIAKSTTDILKWIIPLFLANMSLVISLFFKS